MNSGILKNGITPFCKYMFIFLFSLFAHKNEMANEYIYNSHFFLYVYNNIFQIFGNLVLKILILKLIL